MGVGGWRDGSVVKVTAALAEDAGSVLSNPIQAQSHPYLHFQGLMSSAGSCMHKFTQALTLTHNTHAHTCTSRHKCMHTQTHVNVHVHTYTTHTHMNTDTHTRHTTHMHT